MATLEEPPYASSVERISLHNLSARHVPDVPEDVDFLMEHLNDPNFDLTQSRPPSFSTVLVDRKPKKDIDEFSDVDVESRYGSDRYSTSRADSTVDFDA